MRNIYFTISVFGFLLLDVISKKIAQEHLVTTIEVIPGFFSLQKIYNTGIAFSLPVQPLILKIMTIVLIFGIIWYYFHERQGTKYGLYDLGFSMILAGAIGNAIGRIFYGRVIDFFGVRYFSVFNVADICICVGVALLMYWYWKQQKKKIIHPKNMHI